MWYPFKDKRTLGKRFVTGVAPSLQNWWTVERSLVGSTPIRFRQKESQKAPQSLKSLAGLFIQVSYSPRVSLGIWIYRYFVGISDGIFICWVPFAIRNTGSRWGGPQACSACRAGVPVAHPWDIRDMTQPRIQMKRCFPWIRREPPRRGAVLVCEAAAAGSFGALIMMSGPMWTVGDRKEEAPNREEGGFVVWEVGKF